MKNTGKKMILLRCSNEETTAMIFILFLMFMKVTDGERLKCNQEQFAERNKPFVVSCNGSESVNDVYWYKGVDISGSPILVFENGIQRGKEYQKGEYELISNFSLKIIDVQVKHEGSYTLRIYSQDHLYEEVTTAVRVYELPNPPCPYVNACDLYCNGCNVNTNTSGYLVCYINGSRPKFDISWKVDNISGMSYATEQQLERSGDTGDTWLTERRIEYTIHRCGAAATFHCMAEVPVFSTAKILETYSISVQIRSENCQVPILTETSGSEKISLSVIFLPVIGGTAVIAFFVLVPYLLYRREDKKKILITNLLTVYETFVFVSPLPWEEPISISALYTPPKCSVTDKKKPRSQNIDSKVLMEDFIVRNKRTLLIADMGHGKTSFTKYVVNEWVTNRRKENCVQRMNAFILIHVDLKDVRGNDMITEIVQSKLHPSCKLTSRDIDEILHKHNCIVVFSGLDEISMSTRPVGEEDNNDETVEHGATVSTVDEGSEAVRHTNMGGGDDQSKLTVNNILRNTYDWSRYKKLKVLVTSNYIDAVESPFVEPFVKVTLNRFTKDDREVYIHNTCKYYLEKDGRGSELAGVKEEVAKLIELNEIVQIFEGTPLMLMMIIHLITSTLVNDEKYEKVDLHKITTVMKLVMLCLESRYLKKFKKGSGIEDVIKNVKKHLGELAFENPDKEDIANGKEKLGKLIKPAMEIGFIKYSDKLELEKSQGRQLLQSSFSGIVFCHEYFKEYFAAQHLLENSKDCKLLNDYINKSDDEGAKRILQFMCGLNHQDFPRLLKDLLNKSKQEMWNILMDCMYEISEPELQKLTFKEFAKKYSSWAERPIISIKYLEKAYHKRALAEFCRMCCEHDIKLKLGFQENCAITFVNEVELPHLMSLVFTDMSFEEDHYVSVITSLTSARCTALWFVRCNTPTELSQDNMKKVNQTLERTSMKIHLSEDMPPQDTVVH